MTLAESLLPRLSEWRPAGAGRHSWAAAFPDAGWSVCLAADKADTLSCLAWELSLTRTAEPPAGLTLAAWATGIAGRTTGLLEPLAVHEVDEHAGEALLRSATPAKKGEWVSYYEVRLGGLTTAVVRRYTATRAEPGRDQVAFAITHEALAKLAGDIAG
jgi:hypothetical protein